MKERKRDKEMKKKKFNSLWPRCKFKYNTTHKYTSLQQGKHENKYFIWIIHFVATERERERKEWLKAVS